MNIQAKVTGVNQIQERHALPDSSSFIEANPDKFERLPDYGNMFTDKSRVKYGS